MFKVLQTLSERASAVWTVICSLARWDNFTRSLAFTKASERVQCGRCFTVAFFKTATLRVPPPETRAVAEEEACSGWKAPGDGT